MNKKKQLTVLGSTGSIGTQALDVIRQHPDKFEVYALTANVNVDKLAAQAREFLPDSVVIADETKYEALKDSLAGLPVKVYAGSDAVATKPTWCLSLWSVFLGWHPQWRP